MRNSHSNDYIGEPLLKVFNAIYNGMFGDSDELKQLIDTIRYNNDNYLVCHDFYSYCEAQEKVFFLKT